MISFAAFTPDTPLLVPAVGKDASGRMPQTVFAMRTLADELYASRPDTILLVSSHAAEHPGAFSGNLHDAYVVRLDEFGDYSTTREFLPNLGLVDAIQRSLRRQGIPFTLDSDAALDYGAGVPLVVLAGMLPRVRVVPLSVSGLGPKEHFQFGRALRDVCSNRPERIAVIASGDLSHALSTSGPAGFRPEGRQFDDAVRSAIEQGAASQLLSLDPAVVKRASEFGYRPLLVLMGLLDQTLIRPEILSYEHPFGVGYLVVEFR